MTFRIDAPKLFYSIKTLASRISGGTQGTKTESQSDMNGVKDAEESGYQLAIVRL